MRGKFKIKNLVLAIFGIVIFSGCGEDQNKIGEKTDVIIDESILNPNDSEAYYNRGVAYFKQGNLKKA